MAHFVQLDEDNVVTRVIRVGNERLLDADGNESEELGIAFLKERYDADGIYKQTSYNTRGGKHRLGGTPFRGNYCGAGCLYDSELDIFLPPKPYPSWVANGDTCRWEPPVPMPDDAGPDKHYEWNEESGAWEEFTLEG